jgi:hypothetical protein
MELENTRSDEAKRKLSSPKAEVIGLHNAKT